MMIVLYTDKGYWTGFIFKADFRHPKVKQYKTMSGARRAVTWMSKAYRRQYYVCQIIEKGAYCAKA